MFWTFKCSLTLFMLLALSALTATWPLFSQKMMPSHTDAVAEKSKCRNWQRKFLSDNEGNARVRDSPFNTALVMDQWLLNCDYRCILEAALIQLKLWTNLGNVHFSKLWPLRKFKNDNALIFYNLMYFMNKFFGGVGGGTHSIWGLSCQNSAPYSGSTVNPRWEPGMS